MLAHGGHVVRSVDPDGALAGGLPLERSVPMFAFESSQVIASVMVRHQERPPDKWVLGELEGSDRSDSNARANAVADLVSEVGDAREWMWNKQRGNIFSNPVSAITRQPLAVIARHPAARAVGMHIVAESASVSSVRGRRISMSFEERIDLGIALATARPSDEARRHCGRHARTAATRRRGNTAHRIVIGVFAVDRRRRRCNKCCELCDTGEESW